MWLGSIYVDGWAPASARSEALWRLATDAIGVDPMALAESNAVRAAAVRYADEFRREDRRR
jgi:hypothetical protein